MSRYRHALPQLGGELYLTDGGIETTLIFNEGLELPDFAAFHLLQTPQGAAALKNYFGTYADLSKRFGTGLILESATWRANADWGKRLDYTSESLSEVNLRAIQLLEGIRQEMGTPARPVVISGCLGPRGDGYVPDRAMSAQDAREYHLDQVRTFARSAADMVCAMTMNYVEEALGIVQAAAAEAMPVAISFTVETDGNLPTGQRLGDAIEDIDRRTKSYPIYYMINCAHPTHFSAVLEEGGPWRQRIRGLRANASRQSHAELNDSPELDAGNPAELGKQYAQLKRVLPHLNVVGGCCGTDHRHVEQIAQSCLSTWGQS
jgi:S-methylmethionine-dependent homocysteine/selenocysteine methylase